MSKRGIEEKRKKAAARELNKAALSFIDTYGRSTGQDLRSATQKYRIGADLTEDDMLDLDAFLLDEGGHLRIMPEREVERIPLPIRSTWMQRSGYWVMPTIELIEGLKEEIGEDLSRTIEIAAGAGILGRALGCPSSDFMMAKRNPVYAELLRRGGHRPANYGPWVEELEASAAVYKYRPRVVVGSYVIRRGGERLKTGPDEKILMQTVPKMILIQPRDFVSNEFFRKARVLPVKVFSKGDDSKVMVRTNIPTRAMTEAESNFMTRLVKEDETRTKISSILGTTSPDSGVRLSGTRTKFITRRQI